MLVPNVVHCCAVKIVPYSRQGGMMGDAGQGQIAASLGFSKSKQRFLLLLRHQQVFVLIRNCLLLVWCMSEWVMGFCVRVLATD